MGNLVQFSDLASPSSPSPPSSSSSVSSTFATTFPSNPNPHSNPNPSQSPNPIQACTQPHFPPIRYNPPTPPYKIALIERGSCDFATKVLAAQERGMAGVIVGDGVAKVGESIGEGRERESLITMFSPGTSALHFYSLLLTSIWVRLRLFCFGSGFGAGALFGRQNPVICPRD